MELKRRVAASLATAVVMTFIGAGAAEAQTRPGAEQLVQLVNARSTPEGTKRCQDIDSAGNEYYLQPPTAYVSAVCDGRLYVLTVDESTSPPTAIGNWQLVGGPTDVVGATVASNIDDVYGGPVLITALTRRGDVWHGTCANSRPIGSCTFTSLPHPPQ
ncbi:hypothetical protein ACH4UM_14625 [Streptomyces sp. NPDC020801]|uniref:hypothetical protein n=1 Tax=unclassified Streptomyces TaxID=2593676 RepID=UPI00378EA6C1